jgi:hypothetical protein
MEGFKRIASLDSIFPSNAGAEAVLILRLEKVYSLSSTLHMGAIKEMIFPLRF